MKVKHEELLIGREYNLRHYGQVWLRVRYMGLVDNGRLCEFRPVSGTGLQYNQVIHFDIKSTRWDAYMYRTPEQVAADLKETGEMLSKTWRINGNNTGPGLGGGTGQGHQHPGRDPEADQGG